jgi:hypothetical protein
VGIFRNQARGGEMRSCGGRAAWRLQVAGAPYAPIGVMSVCWLYTPAGMRHFGWVQHASSTCQHATLTSTRLPAKSAVSDTLMLGYQDVSRTLPQHIAQDGPNHGRMGVGTMWRNHSVNAHPPDPGGEEGMCRTTCCHHDMGSVTTQQPPLLVRTTAASQDVALQSTS